MHPLDGPRLKLRRAEKHLNAAQGMIDAFVASKPYTFTLEANPAPPNYVILANVSNPIPDDDLSCIIGDFAHNARSALDLTVNQLSALPFGDAKRIGVQFPIYDAPENYRRNIERRLAMVSVEQVAIIEGFQPYKRVDGYHNDALWILQSINNTDKHRTIHVIGGAANFGGLGFKGLSSPVQDFRIDWTDAHLKVGEESTINIFDDLSLTVVGDGVITKNRTVVAKITAGARGLDVRMHPEAEILVKFGEGSEGVAGRPVMDTLTFIYDRVKEVIGEIEKSFLD